MNTDADLKRNLLAELAWDPAAAACPVDVVVRDGVATVVGIVDSYARDCAIRRALYRVAGLRAIAPELTVEPPPEWRRSDAEIARVAEQFLRWNTRVPAERIHVGVEGGHITLTGDVEWDYQRRSAENALCHLPGVRGIGNEIIVTHCRGAAS